MDRAKEVLQSRYDALENFLTMAFYGATGNAAPGEIRAARLAKVMVSEGWGLEDDIIIGACEWLRFCNRNPQKAAKMLK